MQGGADVETVCNDIQIDNTGIILNKWTPVVHCLLRAVNVVYVFKTLSKIKFGSKRPSD